MFSMRLTNASKPCIIVVLLVSMFTAAPALAADDTAALENRAMVSIETGLAGISAIGADTILHAVEKGNIPLPLKQVAVEALKVARLDISTEDKAAALVEAMATNCNDLFYATITAVAIDIFIDNVFFNMPGIELIVDILAGLTIICYLGLI